MSVCYTHKYIYKVSNICVYTVRKAFNYVTAFLSRVFSLLSEQDRPALHVGHLTEKAALPCMPQPR